MRSQCCKEFLCDRILCGPTEPTPSYQTQVGAVVYSMEDLKRQAQVKRFTQAGIEAGEHDRRQLTGVKTRAEVERVRLEHGRWQRGGPRREQNRCASPII